MKKILSVLLTLTLLCALTAPVFAIDTTEDIRLMLEDQYNGVETETQFGYFVPTFTVFKDKGGVINVCADSWHMVFRDIIIINAPVEEKKLAIKNICKHMENIANALIKKYPKEKFKGWYESNYENFRGEETTFKTNTWTNTKDNKVTEKIIWLTDQDSNWMSFKQ